MKNNIHSLPIVADRVIVGIITTHDLLELAINISDAKVSEDDFEFDPV